MLFLYATDLHGDQEKYKKILSYALDHQIKIIHLGADILPKGRNLPEIQMTFVKKFLKEFYQKAKDNGIKILATFGNDDLVSMKKEFRKFGSLLNEEPVEIEGFLFKAYPYVCDYPFALKSICKLDYRGWMRPFCLDGVDYTEDGKRIEILDIDKYLAKKSTIQEDLAKEVILHKNLIMSCHMPPKNLELDVCGRRTPTGYDRLERVGSKSIYEWIKVQQPTMFLCGHIHESHSITNVWRKNLNKTLVIQPGQMQRTTFVLIKIENEQIETELIFL